MRHCKILVHFAVVQTFNVLHNIKHHITHSSTFTTQLRKMSEKKYIKNIHHCKTNSLPFTLEIYNFKNTMRTIRRKFLFIEISETFRINQILLLYITHVRIGIIICKTA